jgi:hypothetical protein
MTTYTVKVNGETYTKRSATKAYPAAIVQTWTEHNEKGSFPRTLVSFAGSLDKAERECRTRETWQARDPEAGYAMEIVPTEAV